MQPDLFIKTFIVGAPDSTQNTAGNKKK